MSDSEHFPQNDEGSNEPIHIQDALREEVDRLVERSQEHYDARREEESRRREDLARKNPELYSIEEEIGVLRQKSTLTDEETARLAELRIRYDALILGGGDSNSS